MLTRKRACEQLQKFGEHEQASTRLNFASKSSKGKILRAVKNFPGPFITPFIVPRAKISFFFRGSAARIFGRWPTRKIPVTRKTIISGTQGTRVTRGKTSA